MGNAVADLQPVLAWLGLGCSLTDKEAKTKGGDIKFKAPNMEQDTATRSKWYRQPKKDWKEDLIDKASLTYICTSKYRYQPKTSMLLVEKKTFTENQ